MDRRRFVPSPEGLEGRALLSLLGSTINRNNRNSDQNVPETYLQKEVRIKHLPFYLRQADTQRFLPAATVARLEGDLNAITGQLHSAALPPVTQFDLALRDSFPNLTVSTAQAQRLSHTFGSVLLSAGATPEQTFNLQTDMNRLVAIDVKSVDPSILASNDYSIVLQTALAVGRPIKQPEAPILHKNDGAIFDGGKLGRTHDHTPTLIGTYNVGLKGNGITEIQIVTANGNVLGTGKITPSTGAYSVKIANPLPDGSYNLYTRAIDPQGHTSDLSFHYFGLKVFTTQVRHVTRTVTVTAPAGPLGLDPFQPKP